MPLGFHRFEAFWAVVVTIAGWAPLGYLAQRSRRHFQKMVSGTRLQQCQSPAPVGSRAAVAEGAYGSVARSQPA